MTSRFLSAVRRQPLVAFFVLTFALSWEEIGWRGYAMPRLQTGRSALGASLILGPVWGSWHLPLYFTWQAGSSAFSPCSLSRLSP
jgi:membrane protease YdiL (CAAX protease family)